MAPEMVSVLCKAVVTTTLLASASGALMVLLAPESVSVAELVPPLSRMAPPEPSAMVCAAVAAEGDGRQARADAVEAGGTGTGGSEDHRVAGDAAQPW